MSFATIDFVVIPESIDYELTGSRSIRTGECRSLVDLQRRSLIPMINVMNPVENVEQRLDVDVFQIDDISPILVPSCLTPVAHLLVPQWNTRIRS